MSNAFVAQGPFNATTFRLPALSNRTVFVRFIPTAAGIAKSAFAVRNNLTVVEILRVVGETGRYTFGFPKVRLEFCCRSSSSSCCGGGGLFFFVFVLCLLYSVQIQVSVCYNLHDLLCFRVLCVPN